MWLLRPRPCEPLRAGTTQDVSQTGRDLLSRDRAVNLVTCVTSYKEKRRREDNKKMWSLVSVFSLTLSVTLAAPSGKSSSSLEVLAGESLTLYCPLFVTNNSVILWSKDTRIMFAGALRVRMDDRYQVVNDNLLISSVTPEDAGEHSCQVEDEARVLKMFTYSVRVLAPAKPVISVGEYLAIKQGTSLALDCAASGVPVPEVTWRLGSQTLARGIGEATLLLEYVTREDAGDLICEANNGIGDIAEDILALDVLFAPEVQMLEPHISFQPKCGLELQCVVHSSSEPRVDWMRDGLLLKPTEGVTIWSLDNLHVLQISRCDSEALGRYSCRAENNLGGGSAQTEVSPVLLETELQKFQAEEERVNNVRRNVEIESQESLPFKSSSIKSYLSFYSITFLLIIFRLP